MGAVLPLHRQEHLCKFDIEFILLYVLIIANCSQQDEEKKKVLPLEFAKDGMIGTVYLASTSVFDHGAGPEVYLHFKLQGTASISGHNMDLSGAKGFITVSSTEWGVSRPDYCNVTYQIMGLPPRNVSNPLPVLQSPKDVSFIFAANPNDNQVGVNASIDPDAIKDMIGYALKGIFFAHEKAAGWVIGKV